MFQCLTTFWVKKCFLINNLNLSDTTWGCFISSHWGGSKVIIMKSVSEPKSSSAEVWPQTSPGQVRSCLPAGFAAQMRCKWLDLLILQVFSKLYDSVSPKSGVSSLLCSALDDQLKIWSKLLMNILPLHWCHGLVLICIIYLGAYCQHFLSVMADFWQVLYYPSNIKARHFLEISGFQQSFYIPNFL